MGWTEKLGGEKNQVVKIRTEVNQREFDALQAEIAKLDGDEVRIRAAVDKSSLRDIDGLADYAISQSKKGKAISYEGVNELNNAYIANQAHGFIGVNAAIKEYNLLIDKADGSSQKFVDTISKSNAGLGKYLSGLNGAKTGILSYGVSLVGATVKTFALEAATMALNATISFGISAGIQLLIGLFDSFIKTSSEVNEELQSQIEKHDENIQKIDEEISKLESEKDKLESVKASLNDAIGDKQKLADVQSQLNEVLGYTPNLLGDETDAIKNANIELEREIALKEEAIRKEKEKRKEEEKGKQKSYRDLVENNTLVYKGIAKNFSASKVRSALWDSRDFKFDGETRLKDYTGSHFSIDSDEWKNYLNEQKQNAHKGWAYLTEQYTGKLGQGFALQILDSLVEQGYGSGDITKYYENILNSLETDIDPLIEKYYKTGSQEDFDALRTGLNKVGGMYWQHNQLGAFDNNLTEDALSLISKAFEAGTEAAEDYENRILSTANNLSEASDKIKTLSTAFKELSEDGYITTGTIAKIQEATKLGDEEFEQYKEGLLSAKKGSAEFNKIMGQLTYTMLENTFEVEGLKNATEEQVAAVLRENGVLNANEYAKWAIAKANGALTDSQLGLISLTSAEIKALVDETMAANETEGAINYLKTAHDILNNTQIDTSSKIKALESLRLKALETGSILSSLGIGVISGVSGLGNSVKKTLGSVFDALGIGDNEDISFTTPKFSVPKRDRSQNKSDAPDKEDNTEAVINRINLRAKEIEQQEKQIENAMELAEIEEDYGKQIALSSDLLEKRKKEVGELNTANAGLHNEAEYLRNIHTFYDKDGNESDENTWFDSQGNATEAYYDLINKKNITTEEKEAIESLFESLSKYKKAYADNVEKIAEKTKQIKEDEKAVIDYYESALEKGLDDLDRYTSRIIDEYEDEIDFLEKRKTKEESLLSIKEKQYEITNDMADAQHEVDKEIEKSRRTLEYLDKDMVDGTFNEDDYAKITDKIEEISADIADETAHFENKINSLGEDEMYLAETITAEYERRVEMKKQELEIVKAEIDLQKKKDQLDNVLANRNTRVFRDGQWVWTYDNEKAQDAIDELSEAEYNLGKTKREKTQQADINNKQTVIDNLTNEIGAYEKNIEKVNKATEDLEEAIDEIINPVLNIGAISDYFAKYGVGTVVEGFNDLLDSLSKLTGKAYKNISGFDANTDYSALMAKYPKNSLAWSLLNQKRNAKIDALGLSYNKYASGTSSAKSGLSLIGEKEPELLFTKNGLYPIDSPILTQLQGGEVIFNQAQLKSLGSLLNYHQLNSTVPYLPDLAQKTGSTGDSIDNSINIGNLEIDGNSQDGKELNNILRRIVATHSH